MDGDVMVLSSGDEKLVAQNEPISLLDSSDDDSDAMVIGGPFPQGFLHHV